MNDLKSWSTPRMMEAGVLGRGMMAWSGHGSTRYLWKPEAVEVACRYVTEGQGAELPLQKLPSGRDTDRARDSVGPLPDGRSTDS
jgi:hypothetical protein